MQSLKQKVKSITQSVKLCLFEFIFVLQHNKIHNRHLSNAIELSEIIPLVYLYVHPQYWQLWNFSLFRQYFQDVLPGLILIKPNETSQSSLLSFALLLIFPVILVTLFILKLTTIGYQYLAILTLEIALLFYPIIWVKVSIETFNLWCITEGLTTVLAVGLGLVNLIFAGCLLRFYQKTHMLLDFVCVFFVYFEFSPYLSLSVCAIKVVVNYFWAHETTLRYLRIAVEANLLLIVVSCFFVTDYILNYVGFLLVLSCSIGSEIGFAWRNSSKKEDIFYHLEKADTQQQNRLEFYAYLQDHRIQCEYCNCMCRKIAQIKGAQEVKQWGYRFIQNQYQQRQDFDSIIEMANIATQHYQYSLSGLLKIFSLKPANIYEQYQLYYIKTKYEQQYRKNDKIYSFGCGQYENVYEELRKFEEEIEDLTQIIKEFWNSILFFDGSKKFLGLIIEISHRITKIKEKYAVYSDKYQQFNQFKYLYKTFQIAILNMRGNNIDQIQIQIPQRQLLFVSSASVITNCNTEFSNMVEKEKKFIINSTYNEFIPELYAEDHQEWVNDFFLGYHRQQQKSSYKTISIKKNYIKCIKMTNRLIPRFESGLQVISFIKVLNTLQSFKGLSSSNQYDGKFSEFQDQLESFFTFLIEKNTQKIQYFDDSFFTVTMINETQELKEKIMGLKIIDIFPKLSTSINGKADEQNRGDLNGEVILNYNALEQFRKNMESNIKNNIYKRCGENQQNQEQSKRCIKKGTVSKISYSTVKNIQTEEKNSTMQKQSTSRIKHQRKFKSLMESADQIFQYEVIEQSSVHIKNSKQYQIINFKVKPSSHYDTTNEDFKTKEKLNTKVSSKNKVSVLTQQNFTSESKFAAQEKQQESGFILNDKQQLEPITLKDKQENGDQMSSIPAVNKSSSQFGSIQSSILADTTTEAFQVNGKIQNLPEQKERDLKNQNQMKQQSERNNNSYCLPIPLISALIIGYILQSNIDTIQLQTLNYLNQTHTFYENYEFSILKQLNITSLASLEQEAYSYNLKYLWLEGYGFFEKSLLIFEKPQDRQYVQRLYSEVITQYHFGIMENISMGSKSLIESTYFQYWVLMLTLLGFVLYICIDLIANFNYAFKIHSKVTEIILTFLTIDKQQIQNLLKTIQMYEEDVLEIVDLNNRDGWLNGRKLKEEQYLFNYENENESAIGLIKTKHNPYPEEDLDNLAISISPDVRKKQNKRPMNKLTEKVQSSEKPTQDIMAEVNSRRRSSRMSNKLCIQKLRENINKSSLFSRDGGQGNHDQQNPVTQWQENKRQQTKSSLQRPGYDHSQDLTQSQLQGQNSPMTLLNPSSAIPSQKVKPQYFQQDQQEDRQVEVEKFRVRYSKKTNQIKQNIRLYILILVVFLVSLTILTICLFLLPTIISSHESHLQVYLKLRSMPIIIFKQLIQKQTSIDLLPEESMSVFNQELYHMVMEKAPQLSEFNRFWEDTFKNDICPYIEGDQSLKDTCLSLDNSITDFGHKVIYQYIENLMRLYTATELLGNDTTGQSAASVSEQFIKVLRIELNLLEVSNQRLHSAIVEYHQQTQLVQTLITIIGTLCLFVCIIISHKALGFFKERVNDGHNLLLIVPDSIKVANRKRNREGITSRSKNGRNREAPRKRASVKKHTKTQSNHALMKVAKD